MAPQPSNSGGRPEGNNKRKEPPQGTGGGGGGGNSNTSKQAFNNKDDRGGARAFKRVKVKDARSIRSQPADAALKDGELDLQAFLSARQFEIKALEDGMRKSKALNNRRAFQLVPRGMRRRTASHNVKKLPKRLRARAKDEQLQDNTPTVVAGKRRPKTTRARIRVETARRLGVLAEKKRKRKLREAKEKAKEGGDAGVEESVPAAMKQLIDTRPAKPKIRRNVLNDPPKPKAKFRKRQIDKTWLPTHLWHAKRAKMTPPKEPLWRFAIPLTPNEKVYRPTHRASNSKGAVVWDMSYMSTIGLYGHGLGIERTLRALGMAHDSLWDARGEKWREGRRKWSGILSKQKGDGRKHIGPATVMWNPEATAAPEAAGDEPSKQPGKVQRQVYIRLHPSCFLEVFDILVKLTKRETPRLYVEDLRFEIGSIELTGPGSTEALLGIIRPYHSNKDVKESHAKLFESLSGVSNAAALPADLVLGFSAQDPRLLYPPRTIQVEETSTEDGPTTRTLSDAAPAPCLLFDREARFRASCFPSQKALDRRKGARSPPGQPLQVTNADPPFPVVLFASRPASKQFAQGTWTLLAPWKCILPIWYSLVHYPLSTGGNPRVGGLDELRQVTFEQGLPWFPGDFPGTDAGAAWELEQRAKRKADWERRPKSKRVTWESLDLGASRKGEIGIGWACEFERLFGLQHATEEQPPTEKKGPEAESAGGNHDEMDVNQAGEQQDADGSQTAESPKTRSAPHTLTRIHQLSKPAFNALTSSKTSNSPPPHSIVTVKITYLRDQWLARIPNSTTTNSPTLSTQKKKNNDQPSRFPPGADHDTRKLLLAQSLMTKKVPFPPEKSAGGNGDHPLVPGEEDLIGYVTKGEFNLAEGRGVAVGCISVERALEALRAGGEKEGRVCVVRSAGESVGRELSSDILQARPSAQQLARHLAIPPLFPKHHQLDHVAVIPYDETSRPAVLPVDPDLLRLRIGRTDSQERALLRQLLSVPLLAVQPHRPAQVRDDSDAVVIPQDLTPEAPHKA
ncbi:Ribonucleases P/MRP protein subunit POP1 [Cytospora mali]|uniref:Ribonucleases P/MRP protein subunit POP1 n=1 Tax=Cytospora mali TaxID=578113 RepID=A0A194VE16_CYTMA|nr:Ribonucleases P/MRP protein subunit POP1 [Valsa mali var. pyri (nom. inval.)]